MRHVAVLSVCLLLVLAGCNALPGGGGSTAETTTESVGETTVSDADLPPGLSASGVTDARMLAEAHEDALSGRSYTYDREVRTVAANGTELGRWGQHTQVGADRLRFNHTQTGTGVSVGGLAINDTRIYTNGSVTFWNTSAYAEGFRRDEGRGFAENTFSSTQLLAEILNASETSVEQVERDGATRFRVRADSDAQTFTYNAPNGTTDVNATNVTATALVDSTGLVRNVTYEFDFVRGDVSGHRRMTIRYSAVGETEVAVPAWVADAERATNTTREALRFRAADSLGLGRKPLPIRRESGTSLSVGFRV
jgi:hypothetical protein